MIAAWVDIDVFLEALPTVLADVVCGVKFINFSYNAAKVLKIFRVCLNYFFPQQKIGCWIFLDEETFNYDGRRLENVCVRCGK